MKPIPKPVDKKKRKKHNGYKDKANRYCHYTGTPYAERHEVYGGANRQNSIDYKFQVDLCQEIHRRFHNPQTEEDLERIQYWKRHYQEIYENRLTETGITKIQARDLWQKLIGKNYLEEVE